MKSKFIVGQRVGCGLDEEGEFTNKITYKGDYSEDPAFGKVVEILAGGKVKVQFDDDYLNEVEILYDQKTAKEKSRTVKPVVVSTKLLETEESIKEKISVLEKEYAEVSKQISAKLTEAGGLVKEAAKIASKSGLDLSEMYDAVHPLESAMQDAGWNTSSWYC